MIDDPYDKAPSKEHNDNEVEATLHHYSQSPIDQFSTNEVVQKSIDDEPIYHDELFTDDLDIPTHSSYPYDHICENVSIDDEF